MFSPFSTFPVPNLGSGPQGDHLMDWVGWRGAGFIALAPVEEAPPQELAPEDGGEELVLFRLPRKSRH